MVKSGVCVSLGADSANGSDHINMLRIMNLVAALYKDVHMNASVLPAERVLEMATIRGAEALLLDTQIGSIEPGKKADLVLSGPREGPPDVTEKLAFHQGLDQS